MKKTAVILFNLGGPDNQAAVRPFLFNLFNDKAIIRLPQPMRYFIAKMISSRRETTAKEIYAKLGGGSPILKNTEDQARALEQKLGAGFKCFIAMSYWHPFSHETARQVKDYAPDEIILLPLYPQFSTTTTASSLASWKKSARAVALTQPTKTICCYPTENGFIETLAASIRKSFDEAKIHGIPRVLFSAHGLPEKIVQAGDPYQWQCERTAEALVKALNIPALDWRLCYQSRVGPLKWIGPSTDEEVMRAGADKKPVVIAPIAFVSEHSETLVEIDMEYRELAKKHGVPFYAYVPTVSTSPDFIAGLAGLIQKAQNSSENCLSGGSVLCPPEFSGCCRKN
ncbi:MAG TPA: ferrochelatase [Alphaproteobacteria bacterium]|nr:ferrochelatase [Alphaproteobacteria bacterium]